MRILLIALTLLPATALLQEHGGTNPSSNPPKRQCVNADQMLVAKRAAEPLRMRPLGEEPLANEYKAVLRIEDGCDKPVKVREDVGREQR